MTATGNRITGTSLYYPFIHPRNINNLKAALIYWDRIRRIVPQGMDTGKHAYGDEKEIEMLAEGELLVSTSPQSYEIAAEKKFFEHIQVDSNRFRLDDATAQKLAEENKGIHVEKISYSALDRLKDMGLAKQHGDWISMRDELAATYMFCLASEMSNKMAAPLLTDSAGSASIGQSLMFEPQTNAEVTSALLAINIDLPTPEELASVDLKDFIKFINKRKDERSSFREAVQEIINMAQSMTDKNAFEDYLETQKSKVEASAKDLRASLRDLNILSFITVAKLTTPAGFGAIVGGLEHSPELAAILGAIGLAISGVECLVETQGKLREAKISSPYHYLLSIERELKIKKKHKKQT